LILTVLFIIPLTDALPIETVSVAVYLDLSDYLLFKFAKLLTVVRGYNAELELLVFL